MNPSLATVKPILRPWAGKMTARERFLRQMNFQSFDRSFNMEFGYWDENYTEWKMFRENGIRTEEEANCFLAFDRIECVRGNVWIHPAFPRNETKKDGHCYCTDGNGVLCEILENGGSTIPRFLEPSVKTPEDWKRVKEERFRRDDPARIPDIEALKREFPDDRDYPLGVDAGSMIGKVRDMLTVEGLAYAMYDYPDMVEDMVETCCVLVEDFLDRVLPYFQFDYASSWEDICFKNGPLVTLDFFKNIVVPRYQRIRRKLNDAKVGLWWVDCDGDVRPLLPYFLEGGINCLFPFEVMGCTHPRTLLEEFPGELRIMGGFDKIQLAGGREAIRKYMESLIPCVERGGYIPFCDHRCPPNVPEDDYLYYLNIKQEIFGLKE